MSDPSASYDDVPYDSYAFPQSHPRNLATIAALFGMEPRALERGARVLEVGCAGGGNLLPVAAAYPECEFVGVEISPVQVERAREMAEGAGLRNVTLHCRGLEGLDAAEAGGMFDYIIAHGVYSWVDAPVREELMALCGRLLNRQGVAYVSFNTLPGANARGTLREMLRYHTRTVSLHRTGQVPPLAERIPQARDLFAVLGEAFESRDDPYARTMMGELSLVAGMKDFYIAHEHLEDTNEACYFYEFIEQSRRHGLQFLGDAEMQAMATGDIPLAVRNQLRSMATTLEEAEQYHDFIRNRAFRQALLCRGDLALKRAIPSELIERFHFASCLAPAPVTGEEGEGGEEVPATWSSSSGAVPETREDKDAGPPWVFRDPGGSRLEIVDVLARFAVLELHAVWPVPLSFREVLERAAGRAGLAADGHQAANLARALLTIYSASRGMEPYLYPPVFQTGVSEYPVAPAIIRWQARERNWVTNLRHENLAFHAPERVFISKLDGTRSVADLEKEVPEAREVLGRLAGMAVLSPEAK